MLLLTIWGPHPENSRSSQMQSLRVFQKPSSCLPAFAHAVFLLRMPSIRTPPLWTFTELLRWNESLPFWVSMSLYIYFVTYHLFLSTILIYIPGISFTGIINLLMSVLMINLSLCDLTVPSTVLHLYQACNGLCSVNKKIRKCPANKKQRH